MKSIKELINASRLITQVKKEPLPVVKIDWKNIEPAPDANGIRQLNKLNKWWQSEVADRKAFKILFYGTSAVNKTRAIKMIARQSGLSIHRVKLSDVISKNIKETEKNLDKIFRETEKKDWILFFDEADALFSKRTDIKDSNDRYANVDVNYLMQKLEDHNGLVIFNCKECNGADKLLAKHFHSVVHLPRPVPGK